VTEIALGGSGKVALTASTESARSGALRACANAHLDKSTLTPLLSRLEERGLITVARDDYDHRRKLIAVTHDGVAVVNRLAPSAAAVSDELLLGLTADERSRLLDLLRRAVDRA